MPDRVAEAPDPERYTKALKVVESVRRRHRHRISDPIEACVCGFDECIELAALAAFDSVQPLPTLTNDHGYPYD